MTSEQIDFVKYGMALNEVFEWRKSIVRARNFAVDPETNPKGAECDRLELQYYKEALEKSIEKAKLQREECRKWMSSKQL